MAKNLFVFAIGGSGERVLRSLTMLLAAGTPTFDDYDIYPIILDYDTANADKLRTVELLQNYADVHNAAFLRHSIATNMAGNKNQFFATRLCELHGLDNYLFPFRPATDNEKFREHIGYDTLAGESFRTKQMLESLYDESDRPDTELNLNMDVGFKGNPNIGSVVFHGINETQEFKNFRARFQPQNGDKVVIIGSLFGGTGASGIPEIVKAIDSGTKNALVATILLLPYFHPMEKDGRNDAIKASRFNSKTKAALSFYRDSKLTDKIDKVYYVGDPYPTAISYCDGGEKQKNNANIVELIAAFMIEHYVAGRGNKKQKEYKFSLQSNIVVKKGEKSSPRLFSNDFDNVSKTEMLNHLAELAIGLKLFHDEIQTKNAQGKDFYRYLDLNSALKKTDGLDSAQNELRDLCVALENFHGKYQSWLKELDYEGDGGNQPANAHRLALYDMEKNYSDIILKQAIASDGSNSGTKIFKNFFHSNNKKPSLDDDFLLTSMNNHFKDNGDGEGHYDTQKNAVRVNHEPEWVFADILHYAADEGLKKLQG